MTRKMEPAPVKRQLAEMKTRTLTNQTHCFREIRVAFLAGNNRKAKHASEPRPAQTLYFLRAFSKSFRNTSIFGLLVSFLVGGPLLAGSSVSKEYQVKAAFLYNFAKFVEWPSGVMPNGTSPIVIGVFGKNPFGEELERLVSGRTINEHPVQVRQAQAAEELRSCHLVFVSAAEGKRLPELFAALKGASVLTIGESGKFSELGGTINFVLEGDKLQFEIDGDSASRAGLRISAQLLKLAKTVRGAREIGRN
jgi:uncharacterized protein DUF4154